HLPGRSDWSLNGGVVDEDIDRALPLDGLAHVLWSVWITEITAERHHSSALAFRPYLTSDLGKCWLIARDEQQIGAMRGKLLSTKPSQTAARSCDDGEHSAQ